MRLPLLPVCLAAILTAPGAFAQDSCDRNDDSQTAMAICANADYDEADAKLNKAYGELMRGFGDDARARKLLQTAQRAWIAFRDAECAYSASDSEGGSIHPMLVSQCLTELTNERIRQLSASENCEEGDVSCIGPDDEQ